MNIFYLVTLSVLTSLISTNDYCCEPQQYHGYIRTYVQDGIRKQLNEYEKYSQSQLIVDRHNNRVTAIHFTKGHAQYVKVIDDYVNKIRYIINNTKCKRYQYNEKLKNICVRSREGKDIITGASFEARRETRINYIYYKFQKNGKFVEYIGRKQVSSSNCITISENYQISDVTNPNKISMVNYDNTHFNYMVTPFTDLDLKLQEIPANCLLTEILNKNNDAIPINIQHILSGFNKKW